MQTKKLLAAVAGAASLTIVSGGIALAGGGAGGAGGNGGNAGNSGNGGNGSNLTLTNNSQGGVNQSCTTLNGAAAACETGGGGRAGDAGSLRGGNGAASGRTGNGGRGGAGGAGARGGDSRHITSAGGGGFPF